MLRAERGLIDLERALKERVRRTEIPICLRNQCLQREYARQPSKLSIIDGSARFFTVLVSFIVATLCIHRTGDLIRGLTHPIRLLIRPCTVEHRPRKTLAVGIRAHRLIRFRCADLQRIQARPIQRQRS